MTRSTQPIGEDREKEARKMLADLLNLEEGLNDWEVNFVESLSHQRGRLSEKQIATIENLWYAHC